MTKGVLLFANNNESIDYVTQAYQLAKRINQYLNLPTSIVTTDKNYLQKTFSDYDEVFDEIIETDQELVKNNRVYHDGIASNQILNFRNNLRPYAYDLSPYDSTIVMDVDYIICSDHLSKCFDQTEDFLIYKDGTYLGIDEKYTKEFSYVSDGGIDFYWATVVYFEKTKKNNVFFELLKHIQDNWYHYVLLYKLPNTMYRNDFAFSIAIHIMNDYGSLDMFKTMPTSILYTLDIDILHSIKDDVLILLTGKQGHPGEYVAHRTQGLDVHVMNKFSLDRLYKGEQHV